MICLPDLRQRRRACTYWLSALGATIFPTSAHTLLFCPARTALVGIFRTDLCSSIVDQGGDLP